jgi:TRAP-type C4-dicarboxylate transport system permease small subunit
MLVVVVAVMMLVTAAAASLVGPVLRVLEYVLLSGSVIVILFVMFFVGAEVVMRYVFNAPIAGHLEGSELLLPIIVFLALSYTQATHGHVGMDLVLDALAPTPRRYATMFTLLVSVVLCAILAFFSFKHAYQLWVYDDVTMTPPYLPTWPSGAAITLGYFLISIRMYLQLLHIANPRRFPEHAPIGGALHVE